MTGSQLSRAASASAAFDIGEPQRRGIRLARRPEPVEPVRRHGLLFRRGPVGDDAQFRIDLHRVRVYDDAAELLRQLQRERRLAAGRRPADQHRFDVARFIHPQLCLCLRPRYNPARAFI